MRHVILSIFFASIAFFLLDFSPTFADVVWPEDCGKNKSHNFSFGRKWHYDRLLYEHHTVKQRDRVDYQRDVLTIPPQGVYQKGVITYVEVHDLHRHGRGGCVFLKSGGYGYKNVTLRLESKWGEGYNFIIRVYGH